MAAESHLEPDPLIESIRAVRQRIDARHAAGASSGIVLPDMLGLLHGRDAALGKVASLGTVNPRNPGLANNFIQFVKRAVARGLNWFVRDQVEFNRAAVQCVDETVEVLDEFKRVILDVNNRLAKTEQLAREMAEQPSRHLERLREFDQRIARSEVQFLRTAAEMQTTYQHRLSLVEAAYRDLLEAHRRAISAETTAAKDQFEHLTAEQHARFEQSLGKGIDELQGRFWQELRGIRTEFERLIHQELHLLRQRSSLPGAAGAAPPPAPAASVAAELDWLKFADRFRGSEEDIRRRQSFYLPYFRGLRQVVDLGCGRGEFLALARENEIPVLGVDSSEEMIALCRSRGLPVEKGDLFSFLESRPDASIPAIFCCQVVEHLPPDLLPKLVHLAVRKLERGGVVAIETPNPQCLAIFASHFYLDPTHTRPVPAPLLQFHLEEAGAGEIETHYLSPAVDSMPALAGIDPAFRDAFFGGLDYAILGRKL